MQPSIQPRHRRAQRYAEENAAQAETPQATEKAEAPASMARLRRTVQYGTQASDRETALPASAPPATSAPSATSAQLATSTQLAMSAPSATGASPAASTSLAMSAPSAPRAMPAPKQPPAQPERPPVPRALRRVETEEPETMARPPQRKRPAMDVRQVQKETGKRMPAWLLTALIVGVLVLGGLFAAQSLMQGYLATQERARAAAYQAVVDAHPLSWRELIEQYSAENNLRPAFVEAIILNESSYRTDAESNVGARGLMQLMPDTAEWIAGKLDVSDYAFARMYDAESNIRFGTWYLGYLSKLFRGDPVLVACAYHAGQGEVNGWLSDKTYSADGVTIALEALPDGPTKIYAGRVTRDYGIYERLYYEENAAETDGGDAVPVLAGTVAGS